MLSRAYESGQNFELRLASYLRMRTVATFIAELEGLPVGMVVGNDYGPVAYVSQMAVDPAVQRRGIGSRLMDALTAWADARSFSAMELDATSAGAPLYRRYAFREVDRTDVYVQGPVAEPWTAARRYVAGDRSAVLNVDRTAFGADRSEVIGALIDADPAAVFVAGAGQIDGYAVAQPRSGLLGPVIAASCPSAAQLITAARLPLTADHRVNVPASNRAIAAILTGLGYRFLRSLAHMVRGTRPACDAQRIFARINLGQG